MDLREQWKSSLVAHPWFAIDVPPSSFLNPGTTFCTFYFSTYYSPAAILCHPSLSTALVNKLYDLNDLDFDLPCGGHELDISWPAFSRYSVCALTVNKFNL